MSRFEDQPVNAVPKPQRQRLDADALLAHLMPHRGQAHAALTRNDIDLGDTELFLLALSH